MKTTRKKRTDKPTNTNKQFFLKLLKKVTDYRGDVSHTKRLFKKFLLVAKVMRQPHVDKKHITYSCGVRAKHIIPTRTKRSLNYYLERGWDYEEAKETLRLHQSHGYSLDGPGRDVILKGLEKRKVTNSLKSEEELRITSEKRKRSKTPEGLAEKHHVSVEEAKLLIEDWCDRATETKRSRGYKAKKESTYKCKEFWMARGYTEEEAQQIISKNSNTRSIESIMRSKGVTEEEAKVIQQEINDKCRKTYFSRPDHERREITIKRTKRFSCTSKQSIRFFDKLVELVPSLKNFTVVYGHKNEKFLWDYDDMKIYFYDFCVMELKFIIEYNGILFHPREKDSPFMTVQESVAKDELKKRLANSCKYDIVYVWETENEDERLNELAIEITNRIQQYEHQK